MKAMAKNVNVRMDPGADYPVAAQPGYPDDVAVICHRTVKDGKGHYRGKVTASASQNRFVDGWVCSGHCKGCWNGPGRVLRRAGAKNFNFSARARS